MFIGVIDLWKYFHGGTERWRLGFAVLFGCLAVAFLILRLTQDNALRYMLNTPEGRDLLGDGPEARRECPRSGKTCAGDSQPGTCVRPGSSSQTDACQRQGGRQRPAIQTACAPEEDLRYYRSQDAKDDEGRGQEAHHRSREHHDIVDRPADKRPAHCAGVLLFRVPSNRI